MATPQRIKDQAKLANDLIEQAAKAKAGELEENPGENPGEVEAKATPAEEQPAPQEHPSSDDPESAEYWKKRFVNFKKKHDEEVPVLRSELQQAVSALDDMRDELTKLREERANLESQPSENDDEPVITQADIDEYGEELIDLVTRVSSRSTTKTDLAKEILDLQKRIEGIENSQKDISERQKVNTRQEYLKQLTELVPNWRAINQDVDFIAWLQEPVPGTAGTERQIFLAKADNDLDVDKAASFFTDWLAQKNASDPSEGLDRKVMGDNNGGGNPPPAPAAKTWTRGEIKQFYTDKSKGAYRQNPEQARSIELEINAAIRENRVV